MENTSKIYTDVILRSSLKHEHHLKQSKTKKEFEEDKVAANKNVTTDDLNQKKKDVERK